jgi:large subunit ribosomal protein L22
MEVEAIARYMRIPPRKARLVAATVVGLPVREALTVLDFTPRAAAKEVAKVVKSAAANATNNFNQDEDTLFVKSIIVNEGPTLKRGRARARGMYFSIFKRTSHITAVVDTREVAASTRRRRAAAAGAPRALPGNRAKPTATKADKGAATVDKGKADKLDKKSAKAVAGEIEAAPEVIEAIEAEAAAVTEVEEAKVELAAAVADEAAAEEQPAQTGEEQPAEAGADRAVEDKQASEQADPQKENG